MGITAKNEIPSARSRWAPALITLAAFLAFGLTLKAGFIWDDHRMIEENPRLAFSAANLSHAFTSDPFDQGQNYWRPLQTVSNMLDFAVWGRNPFGFRLTNLLWHAAAAVLFFYLILHLGFHHRPAFWSAVFLAVHPAAAELLLNTSGRSEQAAAALALACVLSYLKERRGLALAFFAAALGFKESGVIAPFLIALCLWYKQRPRRDYFGLLPFALLLPVYLLARHSAIGQSPLPGGMAALTAGLFLKVPAAVLVYLREALLPFDMHSHRMQPSSALFAWLSLPALGALAVYVWRKGGRVGIFCAGWFLLNLAPKIPLLASNDLMLDHWPYLANAGLFLLAAGLAGSLKGWPHLLPAAASGLLLCYTVSNTLARDTDLKIYEHAARRSSSKPMLYNLAREYYLAGRGEESRAILEKISAADPRNRLYLNGLALARRQTGSAEAAFEAIDRALATAPDDPETLMNRYSLLLSVGRKDEAAKTLKALRGANPGFGPAVLAAARLADMSGRTAEAANLYLELLKSDPWNAEALNDYGVLLARGGRLGEAGEYFRKALKAAPGHGGALQNLRRAEKLSAVRPQ